MLPSWFSRNQATIQPPRRSIIDRIGWPAVAVSPIPRLKLVTRPRVGATIRVWLRSNCAVSSADCAARSCGLSAPAGPSASSARRRSASAAATVASPDATDADRLVALRRRRHAARDQLQRPLGLGAAVGQHRLGLGDPRLRGGDVGGRGADRLADPLEFGLGRLHRQPERGRVDLGKQRPRLDDLVVADRHALQLARDPLEIGNTRPSTVPIDVTGAVRSLAICTASSTRAPRRRCRSSGARDRARAPLLGLRSLGGR